MVAASPPCFALSSDAFAHGVVMLPQGVLGPASSSDAALYITARPDRADNGTWSLELEVMHVEKKKKIG
jgi:hypothetical protein